MQSGSQISLKVCWAAKVHGFLPGTDLPCVAHSPAAVRLPVK